MYIKSIINFLPRISKISLNARYIISSLENTIAKSLLLGLTLALDEIFSVDENAAKPKDIPVIARTNATIDKILIFLLFSFDFCANNGNANHYPHADQGAQKNHRPGGKSFELRAVVIGCLDLVQAV